MTVEELNALLAGLDPGTPVFLWSPRDGYYPVTAVEFEEGILYGYVSDDSTERLEWNGIVIT